MFSESLVESSSLLRSRNRLPAILSVGLQVTVAAALIAVPMLHPDMLPTAGNKLASLAPPPTPVPPPPPVRPRVVPTASAPAAPTPTAPSHATEALRTLLKLTGQAVDAPVYAATSLSLAANSALPASLAPAAPTISVTPKPGSAKPIPVSSGVIAGLLIAPIRPEYPVIARSTHTEGTVVIQAIIARDGHIESAHVVSGPTLLQATALEAVRSARYHPYRLNGEPTEVETTISIIFHIGS